MPAFMRAHMRLCVPACMRLCMRACMRLSMLVGLCVRARVYACARAHRFLDPFFPENYFSFSYPIAAKARVRGMVAGSADLRDIFKVYRICNFILLSPTLANERFPLYFSCFGSTTKFDLTDLGIYAIYESAIFGEKFTKQPISMRKGKKKVGADPPFVPCSHTVRRPLGPACP